MLFKNGEIKLNNLPETEKFIYSRLSEKEKREFYKDKAKEMTAKLAANTFIKYCKDFELTIEEMRLALQYVEHEHQSQVKRILENTTTSD